MDGSPASRGEWLAIARIGRPWGRKGEVHVELHTDWPEQRLEAGRELELVWDDGRREARRIRAWRATPKGAVIAFEAVDSIDQARELTGAVLGACREDLPTPEGEVRVADLAGLVLVDTRGRAVGRVREVEEGVASDLLVVDLEGGGEALVPLAPAICKVVDVEGGKIEVDLPPGLIDPEAAEVAGESAP
ncbi:MAG: ribosome maturation factor RimM [Acidobacteriota bacterium]|nr:ribosome maturation factor RimM [Acidobacteriota bacterium]MDQ7086814.1 ribosome maturation factor RimM [Acidobacteriota bacterium]